MLLRLTNARVPPAKMEELAQTMSIPTPAPVGPALLAFTVKPTFLTVLKGECLFVIELRKYLMINLVNLYIYIYV